MIKTGDVEALYLATKERVRALTIERAQRIVEDPDIAHAPDDRDRDLVGAIHSARREFFLIQATYLSARGEYVMLGCHAGEHKYCKRRVSRDGATLVCSCNCHKTKEAQIEQRNSDGDSES
jgi:hypothetical protein